MLYLPEILPSCGVTIAVLGRTFGKLIGAAILQLKANSPMLMIFVTIFVVFELIV